MEKSESIKLWVDYISEDDSTPEGEARKDGLWNLVRDRLTLSEQMLIEVYLEEENTGRRHWELDPNDQNIYLEYLYGTNRLRNMIYKAVNRKTDKSGGNNMPTREQLEEFTKQNGNKNIRRPPVSRAVHKRR